VKIQELAIKGAWITESPVHTDNRGLFREWFKAEACEEATGRAFNVLQANISHSHQGVLRGIHYSLAPGGQGKWVSCVSGSIWDVVVDIRPSSPTFKNWLGVPLHSQSGQSLFISEGLGHGFIALEDNTAVSYLLTSPYSPHEEYVISPFDPDLAIAWPTSSPQMSIKDLGASSLMEMFTAGMLPG
jgi:dTDP-4-dehydrorhamnose 3,5-epimerase